MVKHTKVKYKVFSWFTLIALLIKVKFAKAHFTYRELCFRTSSILTQWKTIINYCQFLSPKWSIMIDWSNKIPLSVNLLKNRFHLNISYFNEQWARLEQGLERWHILYPILSFGTNTINKIIWEWSIVSKFYVEMFWAFQKCLWSQSSPFKWV